MKDSIHPHPFLSGSGKGECLLVCPHKRFPFLHPGVGRIGSSLGFEGEIIIRRHNHEKAVTGTVDLHGGNATLADGGQYFRPYRLVVFFICLHEVGVVFQVKRQTKLLHAVCLGL